ncbi:hypothetical protein NQ314_019842 [Rhamnusium bicolor]|uniref:DDE Tnp4 domain-containing protein n=1 Tax=Rhamnusium bicolor TaxID=1586634 RepID=A0AAV8WLS4_9CUCU|nr:hypothetical protein NQ314_019842 [Rhamnusium bicolor]
MEVKTKLQAPPNSGSSYNYKGSHSISLLGIADAHSRFIIVDIGAQGRLSDSGTFKKSTIGRGFENGSFNLLPPVRIPEMNTELPYVLVGDEAFALSNYMMRPHPRSGGLDRRKKVFNYRLSHARRMVESAFGILATRWYIGKI